MNPVAWMYTTACGTHFTEYENEWRDGIGVEEVTPLYAKREWVGLTDAEIREVYVSVNGKEWCLGGVPNAEVFYDAIEAKLKEKNT